MKLCVLLLETNSNGFDTEFVVHDDHQTSQDGIYSKIQNFWEQSSGQQDKKLSTLMVMPIVLLTHTLLL